MNARTFLELGRVSNLPTVWSNALAGVVLAGVVPSTATFVLVGTVASTLYVGGMVLNDAFDAEIDAQERPERPIPSGRVGRKTVFGLGFGLLGAAVVLLLGKAALTGTGWGGVVAALATAGLIVAYDRWHKNNPASPVVMGLCRVGVYAIAAFSCSPSPNPRLAIGAMLLLGYVLGLTYVAKYENKGSLAQRWPLIGLFAPLVVLFPLVRGTLLIRGIFVGFGVWLNRSLGLIKQGKIPGAVGSMIAGISLLDALLIARYGPVSWALVGVGSFLATLLFQRKIAGT
jgi:4-hydroxybenzoate polyprenyltransferase